MVALSETTWTPSELVAEVERSLEELERLPDDVTRTSATAAVRALLELYEAGLTRIVDEIAARDDGSLAEALKLYRSAGYVEIPRFNDNPYAQHWFEKRLG